MTILLILMSSDLTCLPLELIACYGYHFKIEVAFKQALYTVGTYAYHFWMMAMIPLSRRSDTSTCIVRLNSTVSRCGANSTLTIVMYSSAASRRGCCSTSPCLFAPMFGRTSEAGCAR